VGSGLRLLKFHRDPTLRKADERTKRNTAAQTTRRRILARLRRTPSFMARARAAYALGIGMLGMMHLFSIVEPRL
jgi:hypothetical protein